MEKTTTGNVITTTVDENKVSVHSKNVIIFGLLPSQYYGTCTIK